MSSSLIQCPECRAWLMGGPFNQRQMAPCPACGVELQTEVFPALFRKINAGPTAEAVMIEGEAGCFYHPQKKAVISCDGCGRFLCALCDCPLGGLHYCPGCLETGRTKGKIKNLQNQRTRYDSIALALTIYPLLVYYLTFVTAPMALYVAIRHWNAPPSIVRPTKVLFVAAIVIALLEIGAWAAFIIYLSTRHAAHA